jgi:hypothetical protein
MNARVVVPGIVRPGDLAAKAAISHRDLAPETIRQL